METHSCHCRTNYFNMEGTKLPCRYVAVSEGSGGQVFLGPRCGSSDVMLLYIGSAVDIEVKNILPQAGGHTKPCLVLCK